MALEKINTKTKLQESTQSKILNLLLEQDESTRLQYIKIIEPSIKKQYSHIVKSIFKNGVQYSETNEAYTQLLIKTGGVMEDKTLLSLTKSVGAYLMHECCIGGTEGAKCITQQLMFKLEWVSKLIELLQQGSEAHLVERVKDVETVDNFIKWYLLNNTQELHPLNPAYRTISYD